MKLVIVESPTKTHSIGKYLGADFEVMATMGHIRDLPKSKLGVEIEGDNFVPSYEISEGKADQVKKLVREAKKAEQVYLATDPDREGEAISWHVSELLKVPKEKVSRVVFHAITKETILEAMKHPRQLDMAMVDAQQARRVLDRLVGYKLSPLLWKKVRRGLSAGRVQSVAVRLIVDREKEILAFIKKEYWEIRVNLGFWLDLKKEIHNGDEAKAIQEDLKQAVYTVEKVERKERKASPHPPFKTSTLQQAAANVLGWSSKKTMSVAQKLYEQGNITYHRTDSLNLVDTAVVAIREFIAKEWGVGYVPSTPRIYKTSGKVVAQEAHEAIRPTDFHIGPNSFVGQDVTAHDQAKLYNLIWRRTLACQMTDAVFDVTKIVVRGGVYQLQTIGEIVKFDGWKRLYKHSEDGVTLPDVTEGQGLDFVELKALQKFTEPPARFNDASLVKELEKRGIGRPSTYAPTISTIIDRRYVDRKDRRFYPTTIGMAVTDYLVTNFPHEMDFQFTAKMEENLDEVAKGKRQWMQMIGAFYVPFAEKIKEVEKTSVRVGVAAESTGKTCPLCNEGEVVIREGKFGKFYSCSRFPDCKYTARIIDYVEDVVCEKCGGRVVVKRTKTGREFYGCENYPKCTFASWKKPKAPIVEK